MKTCLRTWLVGFVMSSGVGVSFALTHAHDEAFTSREAAPALEVARGLSARAQPALQWNRPPRAAAARVSGPLAASAMSQWQVLWDRDTGVPNRMFGAGIPAPGAVASPEEAERHARAFLEQHIELLAPGARADDFVVASNHLGTDGMRTIGMYQYHDGMRVLGGQVSVRFKADRLFVAGSEALPFVNAPALHRSMGSDDVAALRHRATAWIAEHALRADATAIDGPYILPIISSGQVTYHTVMQVIVEAHEPLGRWHVYVDVVDGAPVAREQMLRFAGGALYYNVPERHPGGARSDLPAREATVFIDGVASHSDDTGWVSWPGDEPARVRMSASGLRVRVVDDAVASTSLDLASGGAAYWDVRVDPRIDAQLATFIHARVALDHVRSFAPELAVLDRELVARVNLDNVCNAYSDGYSINFFVGSPLCENTGRLADVIYHEFGHVLHLQSLLPAVGAYDGALGEGVADYLAASITGDPGVGRGLFFNDEPLRHLDPPDREYRWPDDIGEIHETGLIFAGAMWDLREALIAAHGPEEGEAVASRLYLAAMQRGVNIPSTYVEILAADDDDGDLSNGTPNECLINASFGRRHGLRDLAVQLASLDREAPGQDAHEIDLRIAGLTDRCPDDEVAAATVRWGLRGAEEHLPHSMALERLSDSHRGVIPGQRDGAVVRFRVDVELVDGSVWRFPRNPADPAYEFYVGEVVPLYCTDFETDAFQEGWTEKTFPVHPRFRQWQWGEPQGRSLDPDRAYSGASAFGTNLGLRGRNGRYHHDIITTALGPVIDVGAYSDVRLQYRRWLTIEDGLHDQAIIYANAEPMWSNLRTSMGSLHHVDSEWVFHDVPLSPGVHDGTVQVSFELRSSAGLELGGWTVDDLCVVANPASICGDGVLSGAEECDDGAANSDSLPDACRTHCRHARCGDGVVDTGEACDDGNRDDGDGCSSACELENFAGDGCACTAGSRAPAPAALLLLVALWAALRQRRCP